MLYNINEEDAARIKNDLLNSFRLKRLAEFTQIINRTKNTALKQAIVQSVFEAVLTQPNSQTYLQACLAHGARVTKKSGQGEYPIHLAAKSRDINNLKLLLLRHEVNVNQLSDDGYSAIDFIWPSHADEISADTFAKSIECINLLHKHGATIDTSNLAKRLARRKHETEILVEFMQGIEPFVPVTASGVPETETETVLLEHAITCGNLERAKQIIESHASPQTSPYISKKVLTICFERGCFEMLEYIFQILPAAGIESRITKKTWLSFLVQRVTGSDPECRFFKCLKLCLTYPQFDIDERDGWDYTALHYAATLKLKHVQELLLQKGAYIGGRDIFGVYTISQIDPLVLVRHFDSCVYTSPRIADEHGANSPIVYVMLSNFVPPKHKENNASLKSKSNVDVSYESMRPALMEFTNVSKLSRLNEKEKKARQQLLEHPVIATFLYIREPPPTTVGLLLRFIRLVPAILLFVPWDSRWFIWCESVLLICLFIFEVILNASYITHFFDKRIKNKFQSVPNLTILCTMLVEIVLIACLIYFTFLEYSKVHQLSCCILLTGFATKRFIASWDCLAEKIHTLDIVVTKIICNFFIYSLIFGIFALSFCVHDSNFGQTFVLPNNTASSTNTSNTTIESISKTAKLIDQLAMFDGKIIVLDKNIDLPFYRVGFVSFLILMPIALANIITAFTITDVSELTARSRCVKIALRFSNAFVPEHPAVELWRGMSKYIQEQWRSSRLSWWRSNRAVNTISSKSSKAKQCFSLSNRNNVQYIAMYTGRNHEIELHRVNDEAEKPEILWKADDKFTKLLIDAAFADEIT
uniref:Ion transport domain-containing protein n=1 Tax=Anopheles coluzzii TaxID=1518534 RepID=A0A6E8VAE9_ANOCL